MKKIFLYGGIMGALALCLLYFYYKAGRFNNTYSELNERMEREEKLERLDSGSWHTNKWEMYHTLLFEPGNTIVIDNHVDTIFRHKYLLSADTLWLIVDDKHRIPNKIKWHNNEQLTFENFLEKKELKYFRKNDMQK